MKNFYFILLLSISTPSLAQKNCYLKLVDAYTLELIPINNSIRINNAKFTVDTLTNIIKINKIFGNKLIITASNYKEYSEKFNYRKCEYDTIVRRLRPVDSIVDYRLNKIWNTESKNQDTIVFENLKELKDKTRGYLLNLENLVYSCDFGMCNYSRTFYYEIEYLADNSVFEISSIKKLQPLNYSCDIIEEYLEKIKLIYPKFIVKDITEGTKKLSTRFTVMI